MLRFRVDPFSCWSRRSWNDSADHFKSIVCVCPLSRLLLREQHYLGCRINSFTCTRASQGRPRIFIPTRISADCSCKQFCCLQDSLVFSPNSELHKISHLIFFILDYITGLTPFKDSSHFQKSLMMICWLLLLLLL